MHPFTIRNNKDYVYATHYTQLFSYYLILNLLRTRMRFSFQFLGIEDTKTKEVRQSVQGHRANK